MYPDCSFLSLHSSQLPPSPLFSRSTASSPISSWSPVFLWCPWEQSPLLKSCTAKKASWKIEGVAWQECVLRLCKAWAQSLTKRRGKGGERWTRRGSGDVYAEGALEPIPPSWDPERKVGWPRSYSQLACDRRGSRWCIYVASDFSAFGGLAFLAHRSWTLSQDTPDTTARAPDLHLGRSKHTCLTFCEVPLSLCPVWSTQCNVVQLTELAGAIQGGGQGANQANLVPPRGNLPYFSKFWLLYLQNIDNSSCFLVSLWKLKATLIHKGDAVWYLRALSKIEYCDQ